MAQRAGVSIATVSRVFNNPDAVHHETLERVRREASALGYRPSALGRHLVRGRSELVGVIVPNLATPLYGAMLHGIETVLDAHGLTAVLMSSLDDPVTERRVAQTLHRHAIDGGIVISSRLGADLPTERAVPWVHVAPESAGLPLHVELDNLTGGRLAAEHLLAGRARQLAYLGGPGREGTERGRGFAQVVAEAGQRHVGITGDYSEASGLACARALLDAGPLDGVFVAGDLMAAGVLRALHERGRRVPQDVSVVGFDDAQIADLLYPRLSTVRQPAHQMGEAAAGLVVRLLHGTQPEPVTFSPALVVRESSRVRPPDDRARDP